MRGAAVALAAFGFGCAGDDGPTDPTDPPVVEPVEWACDQPPAYVGDSDWPWAVDVVRTTTLCGSFDEGRTLEIELDSKAQLQIAQGRYPLPIDVEDGAVRLPLCMVRTPGESGVLADEGLVVGRTNTWNQSADYSATVRQPLPEGGELALQGYQYGGAVGDPLPDLVVDGSPPDPWGDSGLVGSWCRNPGDEWCGGPLGTQFVVCNPTSFRLETHTLTFEGGEMVLSVRMGESAASTEPAAFVEATGTIDGTEFAQKDYWKLIYRPEHHHFSRDFAVLFDTPIGGACGVKVLKLDPWGDSGKLPELSLVECDLTDIESRAVSENVWDRGD